jgi:CelD/BcsL family acetyltransferase involved in cellulose biosynthesis
VVADTSSLDQRLADALAIEQSGWKAARGTAISSRPQTQRFYTEVARWAAERDWLRLVFLRLDGRPIAFHFAIEERGVYYALKGGFDPAFHRFSPGQLLIRATLERAFTRGLRRYELLGGDDDYKLRWATGTQERLLFQAFAPTLAGLVDWAVFAHARPRLKRVLGSTVGR